MRNFLNKKIFIIISTILLIINQLYFNQPNIYTILIGTIIIFLIVMEFLFNGVLDSELSIICIIILVSTITIFIDFYGFYWDLLIILVLITIYLIYRIIKFMNFKDLYHKVE